MAGYICVALFLAPQIIISNVVLCADDVESEMLREEIEVLRSIVKSQATENNEWTKRVDILEKLVEEINLAKENVLSRKRRGVDPNMGYFVGRQGPQGMPGSPGIPGAMGRRGVKGLKGIRGDAGLQGPPGPFGPPGWMGPPGFQGAVGIKGNKGDQGFDGHPGLIGDFGYVGYRGDPGFPGPPGFPGHSGFIGMIGMPGTKGDNGFMGPPGEKGESGFMGLPGPVGMYGEPGLIGELGFMGPFGLSGPQGLKGERGYEGENGEWGPVGAPGPVYNPYAGFLAAPMVSKSVPHGVQGAPASSNCSNEDGKEDIVNCEDLPNMGTPWVIPPFRHPPPAAHVMTGQGKNGQNQPILGMHQSYPIPAHNETAMSNGSSPLWLVPPPMSKSNPAPMYGKAMYAPPVVSKSQMGYAAGPEEDVVYAENGDDGVPSYEDENKDILSEKDYYDDKSEVDAESSESSDDSDSDSDSESESESEDNNEKEIIQNGDENGDVGYDVNGGVSNEVNGDVGNEVIGDVGYEVIGEVGNEVNGNGNDNEELNENEIQDVHEGVNNNNGTQVTKVEK